MLGSHICCLVGQLLANVMFTRAWLPFRATGMSEAGLFFRIASLNRSIELNLLASQQGCSNSCVLSADFYDNNPDT
jgi:hypothetical protein